MKWKEAEELLITRKQWKASTYSIEEVTVVIFSMAMHVMHVLQAPELGPGPGHNHRVAARDSY